MTSFTYSDNYIFFFLFTLLRTHKNISNKHVWPSHHGNYCAYRHKEVTKTKKEKALLFVGKHPQGLVCTLEGKKKEVLKLEEVDKVLRRDWTEASVRVVGCARMAAVLEYMKQQRCQT